MEQTVNLLRVRTTRPHTVMIDTSQPSECIEQALLVCYAIVGPHRLNDATRNRSLKHAILVLSGDRPALSNVTFHITPH